MNETKFTREELHNYVWDNPLSSFISLYGGSYVEVKKLLEDNNIPTPPNGYWSKLKNGHKIPRRK